MIRWLVKNFRPLLAITALLSLLAAPTPVLAYIDPGSGLVLWQGLIALVGVVALAVRNPWQSMKRLAQYVRSLLKR